ncbi:MAG: hypothetical protein WBB42_07100 [Polyangiales bacterium]
MLGRLVDQLVDAGLVTEAQARASDAGDPLVPSGRVAQSLVAEGLDEGALAGFFVSMGFGPMLRARELASADDDLVRRLPGAVARDLCAMPLRPSRVGAIVAMADPTDERSVAKLSEVLGDSILPTVAKLSDLLESIDRAYPADQPTPVSDPVAVARSRSATPSGTVPLVNAKPPSGTEKTLPSFDASLSELVSTASPVWDRAWNNTSPTRDVSLTPKASHIPLPHLSTSLTPHTFAPPPITPHPETPVSSRPNRLARSSLRGSSSPRPPSASDPAIAAQLDELASASSRDEVVRVACQACLAAARGAAFLALRKGVFRGWDGAGDEVTSAGIRSLWIPATNPSILNEVLHSGRVFQGAYGQTAADHLFRAAFGSHGREVIVVPVLVGSRLVGALCANDPASQSRAIEGIAEAMGRAFERLIVSQKSPG